MKRRTLDILFSLGGLALAGLLLVVGLVLSATRTSPTTTSRDQLSEQNITFKTADTLTAEEKKADCLVEYAGQQLTTGKQAECYANNFIGLHLKSIAGGKTYADLGDAAERAARRRSPQAAEANDPALADLQKQLADGHRPARDGVQGRDAARAAADLVRVQRVRCQGRPGRALVAYLAAGLMLLLSIAGLRARLPHPEERDVRRSRVASGQRDGLTRVNATA